MYKQVADPDLVTEAFKLEQKWKELMADAKKKDSELLVSKKEFAKETQA